MFASLLDSQSFLLVSPAEAEVDVAEMLAEVPKMWMNRSSIRKAELGGKPLVGLSYPGCFTGKKGSCFRNSRLNAMGIQS